MRKLLFLFILIISLASCQKLKSKSIEVFININIETLFILYSLLDIGLPPVENSLWDAAAEHFIEYKEHEAVKKLATLIRRTGIDGPVGLMLHYSELPHIRLRYELDENTLNSFSETEDAHDGQKVINKFVEAFSDFYTRANVEDFLVKHDAYYQKTIEDVKKNIPQSDFIETLENYYGKQNKAYILNPSPVLFPGFGFGKRVITNDGLVVLNTFGPFRQGDKNNSGIQYHFNNADKIRDLSVHEFGHSFVNPITELPENKLLIEQYAHLFGPMQEHMAKQGYRNWWICVTEHLVRLGEIRIAFVMQDHITAEKLRRDYTEQRHFIYLPHLEAKINEYENNRDKYPSFIDFFPLLMETFSEIETALYKPPLLNNK
jgi:hypothetical protein